MPRGEGDWTAKPPRAKGERGRAGRTDTNDHNQTACEGRSFSLTILPPLAAFDRGAILPAAAGEPPGNWAGKPSSSRARAVAVPRGGSGERQGRGQCAPLNGGTRPQLGGQNQQQGAGLRKAGGGVRSVPTQPKDKPNQRQKGGAGIYCNRSGEYPPNYSLRVAFSDIVSRRRSTTRNCALKATLAKALASEHKGQNKLGR